MFLTSQSLHFAGIGGIGMSGLAEIAHGLGCRVSGSDVKLSVVTARLERLGIRVAEGHSASNIPPATDVVIATSALRADNPELAEARRRRLPVLWRGELLAEIMRSRRGIAIGGSHGKTTTSSMAACLAIEAGLDPTVFIGTLVPFLGGSNARLGGDLFITECDESDGSFLELAPLHTVVTNIDREHLDHYGTFENVRAAFARFANHTAFCGAAIVCIDDPYVRAMLPDLRRRAVTYGHAGDAHLRIIEAECGAGASTFGVVRDGTDLGRFELHVPGEHYVLNATAVIAIGLELGLAPDVIGRGLAAYRGTGRRMELKGEAAGITVIDDYGHHPTEIRATLAALRLRRPGRLVVLFQPHRYTRTAALLDEFAGAFGEADCLRVMDLYAASEDPIAGVDSAALAARISRAGHTDCAASGTLEASVAALALLLRPGDLVVTLGAGNVTQAGPLLLAALQQDSSHG